MFGFLNITKEHPNSNANGAPNKNPLDSNAFIINLNIFNYNFDFLPAITWIFLFLYLFTNNSFVYLNAVLFNNKVVMSQNNIPGFGKSGIPLMLLCIISLFLL